MAIGNPVSTTSSSVASKTSSVIATAGQTLFTVPAGYVTNHISVFRNGIRLVDGRDYEARNGATVTLLAAATVGDVIEFHVFDTFSVADAVTNQGGTIFGDLTVEGSIGNITGVAATFTGNVNVGGVLTYEDVTNVDSVGLVTARNGINVTSGVVRVGSTDVYNSSDKLTLVNNSGNCSLTIDSTPTGESSVFFADGTSGQDAYRGYLQYNHSNDALLIATSATERIRITSDGKIGINQNTPQTTFHSTGTTNGQQATFGIDDSGLKISTFQKTDNDAGVILDAQKSSNGTLTFATTGTERLRIDSSGNLIIGTTTAATNAKVTVRDAAPQLSLYATPGNVSRVTLGDTDDYDIGQIEYSNSDNSMRFTANASERLRIDSSGRMGLGTASPKRHLHINGGNETVKIQITNTTTGSANDGEGFQIGIAANGNAFLEQRENLPLIFYTNNTEAMRLDSSRRLLINHTADTAPAGYLSKLQLCDTNYQGSSISLRRDQNNSGAPALLFAKSRSSSKGGNTIVQNGDYLGYLNFYGADGGDVNTPAGAINCRVDGTPGSNDMPGALTFATTPDGGSTTVERMRITSSGQMGLGTDNPVQQAGKGLHIHNSGGQTRIKLSNNVTGSTANDGFDIIQEHNNDVHILNHENGILKIGTNDAERMRIDSSGNMSLGSSTINLTAAARTTLSLNGQNSSLLAFNHSDTISGFLYAEATEFRMEANGARPLVFRNNSTTRMIIDTSGRLLLNSGTDVRIELGTTGTTGTNNRNHLRADGANLKYNTASGGLHVFEQNGTERMRIDSSGNMGLGTQSPSAKLHVNVTSNNPTTGSPAAGSFLQVRADDATVGNGPSLALMNLSGSKETGWRISAVTTSANNGDLTFHGYSGGATYSERMRIDNSGRLLIGTSDSQDSNSLLQIYKSSGTSTVWNESDSLANGQYSMFRAVGEASGTNNSRQAWLGVHKHSGITNACGFIFMDAQNSNNHYYWTDDSSNLRRTSSASNIGTTNGTVVGTQTSDERLKNVGDSVSYGLAEVLQLQPKQYALKSEPDVNKLGFIAQEVESIIPEAVFDTKEELEGHQEGDRTQLGMEYVQLIPVLVNAIKEQQTTIADLQSRLSSLEG